MYATSKYNSHQQLQEPLTLPCRHHVCEGCLDEEVCPVCNAPYYPRDMQKCAVLQDIVQLVTAHADAAAVDPPTPPSQDVGEVDETIDASCVLLSGFTQQEKYTVETLYNDVQFTEDVLACTVVLAKPVYTAPIVHVPVDADTTAMTAILQQHPKHECSFHNAFDCRKLLYAVVDAVNCVHSDTFDGKVQTAVEMLQSNTPWDLHQTA
uniref:Tripartite motif-containing protein 5 n=1 Tax=Lygus hesperus TaxID=30085 RepID=A0A0A9WBR3_LYGHE